MKKLLILLFAFLVTTTSAQAGFFNTNPITEGFFKAAGPAGISPETVTNQVLWLKADAGTALDTNTTTTVTDWANQASTGANWSAAAGVKSTQPLYVTNSQNGLPGLQCDGTDDRMAFSNQGLGMWQNISGATVFIVWKSANTGAIQNPLFISTNAGGSTGRFNIQKAANNNDLMMARRIDADSNVSLDGGDNPGTGAILTTVVIDYSTTTATLYRNGTQKSQNTSFQTAGSTTNSASNAIALCSRADGAAAYMNGFLYEIIVYQRALTTLERQGIETYLKARWGLSLAAPKSIVPQKGNVIELFPRRQALAV